jgi:hypothetical protein
VGSLALLATPGDAKECGESRSFNPRVVGSSPTGPTKALVRGHFWTVTSSAAVHRDIT